MAKVYLLKNENFDLLAEKLRNLKGKVMVKMHFGEPGNKTFIKPGLVKKIIGLIEADSFLFDSPVVYRSERDNIEGHKRVAKEHGFDFAPVVVSDESSLVKTEHLDIEVVDVECDSMVLLTHLKGHSCSGFGGAIKNLGMGVVSKKTKGAIHSAARAVVDDKCDACGICADVCPEKFIVIEHKAKMTNCYGCNLCVLACPQKAIKPKIADFDQLIAESANAVLQKFKKVYYINVLRDITTFCDCCSDAGPIVSEDIGILFSDDIVAIEKASHDLIMKQNNKMVFLKSPMIHVNAMAKLIGDSDYDLVEL